MPVTALLLMCIISWAPVTGALAFCYVRYGIMLDFIGLLFQSH